MLVVGGEESRLIEVILRKDLADGNSIKGSLQYR